MIGTVIGPGAAATSNVCLILAICLIVIVIIVRAY